MRYRDSGSAQTVRRVSMAAEVQSPQTVRGQGRRLVGIGGISGRIRLLCSVGVGGDSSVSWRHCSAESRGGNKN